jgi:hypothetical protein
MKYRTALLLLLLAAPAAAQDYVMPRIPTEQEKVDALKLAYRLNGNSMVGNNRMIDLTDPDVLAKGDKLTTPDADPDGGIWPKPNKPVEKRAEAQDTCTRHGMHKSIRGKSWRCVR